MRDTDSDNATLTRIAELQSQGWGDRRIAGELGCTRDFVRRAFLKLAGNIRTGTVIAPYPANDAPASVWAERIAATWRQSVEAIFEVGRLLIAAKDALPHGTFGAMVQSDLPFGERAAQMLMAVANDPRLSNPKHVSYLPASWGTLYELTKLTDDEFESALHEQKIHAGMERKEVAQIRPPMIAQPMSEAELSADAVEQAARDNTDGTRPSPSGEISDPGSRPAPLPGAPSPHMASRVTPAESIDYFPTCPWATRALMQVVLPHLGIRRLANAWEPACGEGHIAEVLREYCRDVLASDFHPHGYGEIQDFLKPPKPGEFEAADWIITNPPFADNATQFMVRALELARVGVAMFLQLRYLEGNDRYVAIFRDRPPTLHAYFVERVPLLEGRFDPAASTTTAYMWLVWVKGRVPQAPFWIPPGQQKALTRPGDAKFFTVHPVIKRDLLPPHDLDTGEILESTAAPTDADAATEGPAPDLPHEDRVGAGPLSPEEDLSIPAYLRREQLEEDFGHESAEQL